MAKKPTKKAPSVVKSDTKVTRISATDTKKTANKKVVEKTVKPSKANKKSEKKPKEDKKVGYFKGSWQELKQVRWPDRAATWKMTGALLLFCAFFVVLILSLDVLFQYIFNKILG